MPDTRGRQLGDMLKKIRPNVYEQLAQQGRLLQELNRAGRAFEDRAAFHNQTYIDLHPKPLDDLNTLRWIHSREAFIELEVEREMHNWVRNLPVSRAETGAPANEHEAQ